MTKAGLIDEFFISMPFARKKTRKMMKTRNALERFSARFTPKECESSDSASPLTSLYKSPEFRLAWDNEISYHVAMNAVHLRQFRHYSQQRLAKAMGTSQSKVARIEGGDDNITLRTLKRIAAALGGRIRFALEPKELNVPALPAWWDAVSCGLATERVWNLKAVASDDDGVTQRAVAAWTTGIRTEQIVQGSTTSLFPEHSSFELT